MNKRLAFPATYMTSLAPPSLPALPQAGARLQEVGQRREQLPREARLISWGTGICRAREARCHGKGAGKNAAESIGSWQVIMVPHAGLPVRIALLPFTSDKKAYCASDQACGKHHPFLSPL